MSFRCSAMSVFGHGVFLAWLMRVFFTRRGCMFFTRRGGAGGHERAFGAERVVGEGSPDGRTSKTMRCSARRAPNRTRGPVRAPQHPHACEMYGRTAVNWRDRELYSGVGQPKYEDVARSPGAARQPGRLCIESILIGRAAPYIVWVLMPLPGAIPIGCLSIRRLAWTTLACRIERPIICLSPKQQLADKMNRLYQ